MKHQAKGAPRAADGRFKNNFRNDPHGGAPMWKFLRDMRTQKWTRPRFQRAENDPVWLANNRTETSLTWIGHASFLIQAGGLNILTDPVFSHRVSPVQWAGPARIAPLGLHMHELPRIDAVLISHNHYDHLDADTVKALAKRDNPQFVVPLGLRDWFAKRGIESVRELDWWQSAQCAEMTVHAVPAQHFSGRGATDGNRSLWCGFVFEIGGLRFYFAGDTGYGADFKQIGEHFASIDISMIPIGAYEPRPFMRAVHVDPVEAVQIHLDVRSKQSFAMHWGTFRLTLEALDAPPHALADALAEKALSSDCFRVLQHGQTVRETHLQSR